MSDFIGGWAVLVPLQDGSGKWRLFKDLIFESKFGTVYTVPKGFTTDLASIPRFLWPVFPPFGKYDSAAILHDWFCEHNWISRYDGDRLFLEAMSVSNVPRWKRYLIYWAVRAYAIVMRIK